MSGTLLWAAWASQRPSSLRFGTRKAVWNRPGALRGARAAFAPVVSGAEQLTRLTATALEDFESEGAVWAHSERWRARSSGPVKKGQTLRIMRVDGLTLEVAPANDNKIINNRIETLGVPVSVEGEGTGNVVVGNEGGS